MAAVFPLAGFELRVLGRILNHRDGFYPGRGDHTNIERPGVEPARTRRNARIGSGRQPSRPKTVRSYFLHGDGRWGRGTSLHLQLHGIRLTPPGRHLECRRHTGKKRRAVRPNLQIRDARGHEVRRVRQKITRARIEPRPHESHENHGDRQDGGELPVPLETGLGDITIRVERFHRPARIVHQRVDEHGRSGVVVAEVSLAREKL